MTDIQTELNLSTVPRSLFKRMREESLYNCREWRFRPLTAVLGSTAEHLSLGVLIHLKAVSGVFSSALTNGLRADLVVRIYGRSICVLSGKISLREISPGGSMCTYIFHFQLDSDLDPEILNIVEFHGDEFASNIVRLDVLLPGVTKPCSFENKLHYCRPPGVVKKRDDGPPPAIELRTEESDAPPRRKPRARKTRAR